MSPYYTPKRRKYFIMGLVSGAVLGWYFSPNINSLVEKAKDTVKGIYSESIDVRVNEAYRLVKK